MIPRNARTDFRVDVALSVTLEAETIRGTTVNLGLGGTLIASAEPLRLGSVAQFQIQLPGNVSVSGLCRVGRRPDACHIAVNFYRMDAPSRAHLSSFLLGYQAELRRAAREEPQ